MHSSFSAWRGIASSTCTCTCSAKPSTPRRSHWLRSRLPNSRISLDLTQYRLHCSIQANHFYQQLIPLTRTLLARFYNTTRGSIALSETFLSHLLLCHVRKEHTASQQAWARCRCVRGQPRHGLCRVRMPLQQCTRVNYHFIVFIKALNMPSMLC